MVPIEQKDWTEEDRASKLGQNHPLDSAKRHIKFEAGVLVFCRHSFVIVATAAQAVNELQRRWIDGSNPCMPHETDDVDDDLIHR